MGTDGTNPVVQSRQHGEVCGFNYTPPCWGHSSTPGGESRPLCAPGETSVGGFQHHYVHMKKHKRFSGLTMKRHLFVVLVLACRWYHGTLSRSEAEGLLTLCKESSYLVRNSQTCRNDYSLSLRLALLL